MPGYNGTWYSWLGSYGYMGPGETYDYGPYGVTIERYEIIKCPSEEAIPETVSPTGKRTARSAVIS